MVLVIMGALEQQTFAVKLERPVLDPFETTETKRFGVDLFAMLGTEGHRRTIELRGLRGPKRRILQGNLRGNAAEGGGNRRILRTIGDLAGRIGHHDFAGDVVRQRLRIGQANIDGDLPFGSLDRGGNADAGNGDGRHVDQADMTIETAVAIEVTEVGRDALGIA